MRTIFFLLCLVGVTAQADVYLGEVKTTKCTKLKGKDFMTYVRTALGDNRLDVTYDEAGTCGKSAYVMKKANRRRWAAFPDDKGCQCYLKTLKVLERSK